MEEIYKNIKVKIDEDSPDDIIRIRNVKKQYRLGAIGGATLREDLQSWWARVRGKEDPNLKIGESQGKKGERFYALNDVSFNVKKQERIGIIGRNGAGKSTLLKLLSRVTAPTEGEIYMKGRIASMLEVGTGFHSELTGRENVYMNGSILGMTKAEIDSKMDDIIEFSEIGEFIDTPVKRYSSGMYVKLAFSVAAHLNSEIMIMDEVLAVGDMSFQNKCIKKMRDVAINEGKTVLYVSHNMNTIRELCDRCIVLSHGEVVFNGDVETAINVYLGNGNNDETLPAKYDLDKAERPSKDHGAKLRITDFEFLGKESAIFDKSQEDITFKIKFKANESIEGVKLYFVLQKTNGDNVGMAQTFDPILNVEKGRTYETTYRFPIKNIAQGKYCFIPDLFSDDGTGRHLSYDHPDRQVFLMICDSNPKGMHWHQKWYGSLELGPLTVLDKSELSNEND